MRRKGNIDPYVITDPSQARALERMLPEIWDERFPEMTRRYLDPRTVDSFIEPAPPEAQAAFEEIFLEEIRNKEVIFGLDPWLKRLTVWQLRDSLYGDGKVYERALIFMDQFDPDDSLPADLAWENIDGRYDRYEGCLGAYYVPGVQDIAYLRSRSDHWMNSGKTLMHVRGWGLSFVAERMKAWRSEMNRMHTMFRDQYKYDFSHYYKMAVRQLGGGQGLNFVPQTSLDQLAKDMEADGTSRKVHVSIKDEKGEHLYYQLVKREVFEESQRRAELEAKLNEVDAKARAEAQAERDQLREVAQQSAGRLVEKAKEITDRRLAERAEEEKEAIARYERAARAREYNRMGTKRL